MKTLTIRQLKSLRFTVQARVQSYDIPEADLFTPGLTADAVRHAWEEVKAEIEQGLCMIDGYDIRVDMLPLTFRSDGKFRSGQDYMLLATMEGTLATVCNQEFALINRAALWL